MKRIIIYITLINLLTLIGGCNEDFIEQKPLGQQSAEVFNPETAVTACYNAVAGSNSLWNTWKLYVIGDIMSDDAYKGGKTENDLQEMLDLSIFSPLASNEIVTDLWNRYYQRIYRFNWTIENMKNLEDINEDLKARSIGEVKFLRALHYFWLNRSFNGVPLVTKTLTFEDEILERSTPEEVYQLIEQDLIDAAQVLPKKSEYDDGDLGRATWGAAKSLLAKVYMYQEKWQDAEKTAKEVIGSDEYSLMNNFGDIFMKENEWGSESIFEINYAESPEVTNGTLHGRAQWSKNGFKGWGFNCPTNDLLNAFEPGDPRIIHTFVFHGDSAINKKLKLTATDHTGYSNPDKLHSRKPFLPGNLMPESNRNNNQNIRVIRYAEVLLIYAEATNENGKPQEALKYLNMVRERARNSSTEDPYRTYINYELAQPEEVLPDITTVDLNELRKLIWHERRVELAMEGDRFFDLVRQKRAGKVLRAFAANNETNKGSNFKDGKSEYMPVPQSEIDATLGKIKQNPGY